METDPFAAISVSCPKCGVGYVVRASPHYVRYGCDSEFEFGKLLQSASCRAAELKAAVAQCEQLECCEVMKSDVSIRIADLEAEVASLRAELRHHAQDAVAKQTQFESLSVAHNEQCRENARLREGVEGLAKWLHTRAYLCDCDGATHCELLVAETRVRHLLVDTAAALAGKEAT